MSEEFERLLRTPISDETANVIHELLTELTYQFESQYFGQICRHQESLPKRPVNQDKPWVRLPPDELPF